MPGCQIMFQEPWTYSHKGFHKNEQNTAEYTGPWWNGLFWEEDLIGWHISLSLVVLAQGKHGVQTIVQTVGDIWKFLDWCLLAGNEGQVWFSWE